jgi:hypothetical protein
MRQADYSRAMGTNPAGVYDALDRIIQRKTSPRSAQRGRELPAFH